jgi:hypothetical protein
MPFSLFLSFLPFSFQPNHARARPLLTLPPLSPLVRQLAETLASGEAAALVEEGLWDMAREVVRAYETGEMPKGSEGALLACWLCADSIRVA